MNRLVVSLVCVVLVATLGAGWAIDGLFTRLSADQSSEREEWRVLGRQLADVLAAAPDREALLANISSGQLVPIDALGVDAQASLVAALQGLDGLALENGHGITVYYALADTELALSLSYPHEARDSSGLRLILTLAFYLSLVALVVAWLLPLLKRLSRLTEASQAFGKGELGRRVNTSARSELHVLERSFNAMASRIESLVEDNRLMSRGVAHDLKTPLARLRFGIDFVREQHEVSAGAALVKQLGRLDTDVLALERLVSVMLDFARLDARLDRAPRERLNLVSVVREAVADSGDSDRITVLGDRDSVHIDGYAGPLRMLLDNLLSNAARHAANHIRVELVIRPPGHVELAVEDDGPGFGDGDTARLLLPFERSDAEPSDTLDGEARHGLGLAIVDRIAAWHHARLALNGAASLGGARVSVVFAQSEQTAS